MKKEQLLHVLRAAADISGEKSFVIVGSQASRIAQIDGQKHNIPVIVAWAERRWRETQGNPTP